MKIATISKMVVIGVLIALLASCSLLGGLLGLNHIKVDGDSYPVSQLALEYWGSNGNGSYNVDVNIFSDGLDWYAGGSGEWVYIDLNSPSTSFADGSYEWSTVRESYTIVYGVALVGFNTSSLSYDQVVEFTGGELSMREGLNDDYIIRFDFEGRDVDTGSLVDVSGHFRGPANHEENYAMAASSRRAFQLQDLSITPKK